MYNSSLSHMHYSLHELCACMYVRVCACMHAILPCILDVRIVSVISEVIFGKQRVLQLNTPEGMRKDQGREGEKVRWTEGGTEKRKGEER